MSGFRDYVPNVRNWKYVGLYDVSYIYFPLKTVLEIVHLIGCTGVGCGHMEKTSETELQDSLFPATSRTAVADVCYGAYDTRDNVMLVQTRQN